MALTEEQKQRLEFLKAKKARLETTPYEFVSEVASGANRGFAAIPDFFIDAANYATSKLPEPVRPPKIPRVQDTLSDLTGDKFGAKGYMAPGLARDVTQIGSEYIPSYLSVLMGKPPTENLYQPTTVAPKSPATDIVSAGNKQGVPVLTSDVRPPQTAVGKAGQWMGERIPLVGTGPVRAGQQEARVAASQRFADKYSIHSYQDVVENLAKAKEKIKSAAGRVLESYGTQLDSRGAIPLRRTQRVLSEVESEISRPGVHSSKAVKNYIDELGQYLTDPQSYTSLKENRTWWREVMEGIDPSTRGVWGTKAKAQISRVYAALSDDLDDFAKQNLDARSYSKLTRANQVYGQQAEMMTRSKLKTLLERGDMTPEMVETSVFSRRPSDVARLYNSLTERGRTNVRGAIIQRAAENASKVKGETIEINPNIFLNELKRYKGATDYFFSGPKNKAELEGFVRLMNATRRGQEAAAHPLTGQALWGFLLGGSTVAAPGTTIPVAGTIGGLARLYESAPVRNALIGLGQARPADVPAMVARTQATIAAAAANLAEEPQRQEMPSP